MGIGIQTVRILMGRATEKQITAKAAFLMVQKLEELAIEITKKAEVLLEQRNKDRVSRNIAPKSKITDELINEVLKGV